MKELLVEQKRRVLHLKLNRPEKRNALTFGMCSSLVRAVADAQDGEEIGVVLISAVGSVFCSGMDLDEAVSIDHGELAAIHDQLFTIGSQSRKPIVIAVNGAALGGGLGLVAQGHIVTSSTGAAFGLPEIKVGFWPFVLYRAIETALGERRTLELSLTGRLFYSQEALEWGLVHNVCPPVEVLDRARGFATDLAKSSPRAITAGLEFVQQAKGKSATEVSALAKLARCHTLRCADFKEGYAAFKSKRPPRWPSMPDTFYDRLELVNAGKVEYDAGK